MVNRRKYVRLDLSDNPIPCAVQVLDADGEHIPLPPGTQSFLRNLSAGGARFSMTGFALPDVPRVWCILTFMLQGRRFALKGDIRWKQTEPEADGILEGAEWTGPTTTYGVSWVETTEEDRENLQMALLKEYEERLTLRKARQNVARHLESLRGE